MSGSAHYKRKKNVSNCLTIYILFDKINTCELFITAEEKQAKKFDLQPLVFTAADFEGMWVNIQVTKYKIISPLW